MHEGDLVEAGQVVVRLDDTATKAKLRQLVLKQYRLVAVCARLEAQLDGRDEMSVSGDVFKARE